MASKTGLSGRDSDVKRSPSQQQTVKLSFSGMSDSKKRAEKMSLTALESESDFSFCEDVDNSKTTQDVTMSGIQQNHSVEEYETACDFLKIVPSKMVIKSLPLSQICLSNYGINHNAVHALCYALKVEHLTLCVL